MRKNRYLGNLCVMNGQGQRAYKNPAISPAYLHEKLVRYAEMAYQKVTYYELSQLQIQPLPYQKRTTETQQASATLTLSPHPLHLPPPPPPKKNRKDDKGRAKCKGNHRDPAGQYDPGLTSKGATRCRAKCWINMWNPSRSVRQYDVISMCAC